MQTPLSIVQINKPNTDLVILEVHFQLSVLLFLLPPQKKFYKMKQRCNTTRYFAGISLSFLKGRTYLSLLEHAQHGYFLKSNSTLGVFHNYLTKTVYQLKNWENVFLNSSFTLRISQQQHQNDISSSQS